MSVSIYVLGGFVIQMRKLFSPLSLELVFYTEIQSQVKQRRLEERTRWEVSGYLISRPSGGLGRRLLGGKSWRASVKTWGQTPTHPCKAG